MNEELKTLLKTVLQESLQPIHHELEKLNKRMDNMEGELQKLNQRMDNTEGELQKLNQRMNQMEDELQLIKEQIKETTDITRVIRDRQEETDAKLDALSMDVNKLHGEIADVKTRIAFHSHKITETELEIFKIKQNQ